MSSIDIIAEILVQEIDSLKDTVKEVKNLQKQGLEIDKRPLELFLEEFNKTGEKIEGLNQTIKSQQRAFWIMFAVVIMLAFVVGGFMYKNLFI